MNSETVSAVHLDGLTIKTPDGEIVAAYVDGEWLTPDGAAITELAIDVPRLRPVVSAAARRHAAEAWLVAALEDLRVLARRVPRFTSDDVWACLRFPPRESRMIGNLLTRARAQGICLPTDEHTPSQRGMNNARPVRVWRSCLVDPVRSDRPDGQETANG